MGSNVPLPMRKAAPEGKKMKSGKMKPPAEDDMVGGFSSLSPELVLNGRRAEALQAGLFDENGKPMNVLPEQKDTREYWTQYGEWRPPPTVVELDDVHVFTPNDVSKCITESVLPTAQRGTMRFGNALLDMLSAVHRDELPGISIDKNGLRGPKAVAFATKLMEMNVEGDTITGSERRDKPEVVEDKAEALSSLKPGTAHGLEDNLIDDQNKSTNRLHLKVVLEPSEAVGKMHARRDELERKHQDALEQLEKARATAAETFRDIYGHHHDPGAVNAEVEAMLDIVRLREAAERVRLQISDTGGVQGMSHVVKHLMGIGTPERAAAARHGPRALGDFEKRREQRLLSNVVTDVVVYHLDALQKTFHHESCEKRIPPGWLRLQRDLMQMLSESPNVEEKHTATFAFCRNSLGLRTRSRDRSVFGMVQNEFDEEFPKAACISGPDSRTVLAEAYTQALGTVDTTTSIICVSGAARSGKSVLKQRLGEMVMNPLQNEGNTSESNKAGTHGCDGTTNGSLMTHDEMPSHLKFIIHNGVTTRPNGDKMQQVKTECTQRLNSKQTSSKTPKGEHENKGGTGWGSINMITAALHTRMICGNTGAIMLEVTGKGFNHNWTDADHGALMSRTVPVTKFVTTEKTQSLHISPEVEDQAFKAQMAKPTAWLKRERVLFRLTHLAKVVSYGLPWLQTDSKIARSAWKKWDRHILCAQTGMTPTCDSLRNERFHERRVNVLRNLCLRQAVAAVFMVGETAVHFPDSRPIAGDCKDGEFVFSHLKFTFSQLMPALKMAVCPTLELVWATWVQSLEWIVGISGACEAATRMLLHEAGCDPWYDKYTCESFSKTGAALPGFFSEEGKRSLSEMQARTAANAGNPYGDDGDDEDALMRAVDSAEEAMNNARRGGQAPPGDMPFCEGNNMPEFDSRVEPLDGRAHQVSVFDVRSTYESMHPASLFKRMRFMRDSLAVRSEMRFQADAIKMNEMHSVLYEVEKLLGDLVQERLGEAQQLWQASGAQGPGPSRDDVVAELVAQAMGSPCELCVFARPAHFYDAVYHVKHLRPRAHGALRENLQQKPIPMGEDSVDDGCVFNLQVKLPNQSDVADLVDLASTLANSPSSKMSTAENLQASSLVDILWLWANASQSRRVQYTVPAEAPKRLPDSAACAYSHVACCPPTGSDPDSGDGGVWYVRFPPLPDATEEAPRQPLAQRRLPTDSRFSDDQAFPAGSENRRSASKELLGASMATRVAASWDRIGHSPAQKESEEFAKLANVRSVQEHVAVSTAGGSRPCQPVGYSNNVFTINKAWLHQQQRMLVAAQHRLALEPGFANKAMTNNEATLAPHPQHDGAGPAVATHLPHAQRVMQHYFALLAADTCTNDTLLSRQQRMTDTSLDVLPRYVEEFRKRTSQRFARAGGAAIDLSSVEKSLEKRLGVDALRLGDDSAPFLTCHLTAWSTRHDPANPHKVERRAMAVKPRCKQSYDERVQGPPPGERHDDPNTRFYEERDGSDPLSTSWFYLHGRTLLEQRYLKGDDDDEPFFRVWADLPDNCTTHGVHTAQLFNDQVMAKSDEQEHFFCPVGSHAAGSTTKRDKEQSPNFLPMHLLSPQSSSQEYSYTSYRSSVPDSIVVAKKRARPNDNRLRSFRQTVRDAGISTYYKLPTTKAGAEGAVHLDTQDFDDQEDQPVAMDAAGSSDDPMVVA